MKVFFEKYEDVASIEAGLAAESFLVDLSQTFVGGTDEVISVNVFDFSVADIAAFKKVVDAFTNVVAVGNTIWKVIKTDKEFDLSASYVRSDINSADGDEIANGTPLLVRFETPGFSTFNFRVISLWYNQSFNPADITILEEIGVTITGNGKTFEITNEVECRVNFLVPTVGGPYNYVIRNDYANEIIAP
jgi:hypothetical protein